MLRGRKAWQWRAECLGSACESKTGVVFTFICGKPGFGHQCGRCLVQCHLRANYLWEIWVLVRHLPLTTLYIILSEDTELGQNGLLIEGRQSKEQFWDSRGSGRRREVKEPPWPSGGGGRVPGETAQPRLPRGPAAWPAHCLPWSPHWSDWINHISHSLIGADNWQAGSVHRKCVQIDLAEWNRKNGDHLISSCAKEGDTKRQCPLWSPAQQSVGMENPVHTRRRVGSSWKDSWSRWRSGAPGLGSVVKLLCDFGLGI